MSLAKPRDTAMDHPLPTAPRRVHLTRLMSIWRSAGWPCRDAIELDLVAAGWAVIETSASGHESLRLTNSGIRLLADARQRNQRSSSAHDRLAARVAEHLVRAGRVVWRELSLRAQVTPDEGPPLAKARWRVARPDLFSVRHTSVENYLQPMVHEVKVSRADLLSDLRHAAKCESYRWLSCETWFVFPSGMARADEIPEPFGIWTLHGSADDGELELLRPARHSPRELPFAVWMAMAKASPIHLDLEPAQLELT
jgi:hypothetical protein